MIRSQRVKGIINCSFKILIDAVHSCVVDVLTWFFYLSRSVLYWGLAFPSPSFVFSSSRSFHPWLPLCFSCFKSQDILSVKINLLKSDPTFFPPNSFKMYSSVFSLCIQKTDHPCPLFLFLSCRVQPNGANPSKEGFDDETNKGATREIPCSFNGVCWARLTAKRAFLCLAF